MPVGSQKGQSTVEYMLLISVIVIAIVAAAYVFIDPFRAGVQALASDVAQILETGDIAGTGGVRN
jgi:uncharacterized protein (UPF0333 family)